MTEKASQGCVYLRATDMIAMLGSGQISACELLDLHIARNEAVHDAVNCVVATDLPRARRDARTIDEARKQGVQLGPLAGLPMTIKDGFDVHGLPAVSGNPAFVGRDSGCIDAALVGLLRKAGAVIWGKTNVPFLCGDFQTYNSVYGTTNNPYDLTRSPSGSSGGAAAALAAGVTPIEIGSDLGGSIRHPAHSCGVYALKPTWRLLPIRGLVPSPDFGDEPVDLAVVGPMARAPADLRLLLGIFRERYPAPRRGIRGRRVALWVDEPAFALGSEAKAAVERAAEILSASGAEIVIAKPRIDGAELVSLYRELLSPFMGLASADDPLVIAARHKRDGMKQRFAAFLDDGWDALLTPVAPVPAFPHNQRGTMADRQLECDGQLIRCARMLDWIALATTLHLPAIVAPAGRTASGLPVGVQLVGRWGDDERLIDYADVLDEAFGFRVPELVQD